MVQSIINISDYLSQIASDYGLTDNDAIIDNLINNYGIPSIDLNSTNIKILHFDRINEYYNKSYFIFKNLDGKECYAINNINIIKEKELDRQNKLEIYLLKRQDLVHILERDFARENTYWAINYLSKINPRLSAKSINYRKILSGASLIFFIMFFFFINLFSIINNIIYLTQNILKALLFRRSLMEVEPSLLAPINEELPVYSILIPLYKEELKVKSILQAMENMNYPKDKLDVKLIIESDDSYTIRALMGYKLPSYVHVIKVPYSLPRTKPKALNYALAYIKGEFLTIYDAEDKPEPDQLLKAIYAFNKLPDNFACVQAKLNFYNAKANFLTQMFSIEYSVWFEYLLKGLSLFNLPVTLGGTSNHFKVDKLKEVGYWDAYNVTEDADLGIRLYLSGYKVHLIDSTTIEEAPTKLTTWIAQRARWIKGFIQTICVFAKAKKDLNKFGVLKIFTVYIFVGLSTYSFFCLPWVLISLTLDIYYPIYYMWLVTSIFSFLYMYVIAYFALVKGKSNFKNLPWMDLLILLCWPLYFILHTIASYRALWEILVAPFKWNKTPHGKDFNDLDAHN